MHPMRHVQASVHRAHGRSRHLHAGRNRRSGHLYSLRSVCQCLSARQHRGTRRALRRTRGYRRPGQNRDRKHFAFGACGTGRDLRSRTGCLRRRKNGRAAAGTGRRLCTRHQLCCRSDHHQGGQRADRARYVRQRSPAPVHQLLPGLGQVRRTLSSRTAAQPVHCKKPHRYAGPDHQDLFRKTEKPRSPQDRERHADTVHNQEVRDRARGNVRIGRLPRHSRYAGHGFGHHHPRAGTLGQGSRH